MGASNQQPPIGPPTTAQPPAPILTAQEALELRVRLAERAHDTETAFGAATNAAAVKSAEEAIKAAMLINGGSSVAMLAFIGTLVSQHVLSAEQLVNVTKPLLYFGAGVAASMFASAASYFTNLMIAGSSNRRERSYAEPFLRTTTNSKRHTILGELFRWLGVLSVAASIGCFILGLVAAQSAFCNLTATRPAPASGTPKWKMPHPPQNQVQPLFA
jgi:hypothetical protein